jgi:hypothetical protein
MHGITWQKSIDAKAQTIKRNTPFSKQQACPLSQPRTQPRTPKSPKSILLCSPNTALCPLLVIKSLQRVRRQTTQRLANLPALRQRLTASCQRSFDNEKHSTQLIIIEQELCNEQPTIFCLPILAHQEPANAIHHEMGCLQNPIVMDRMHCFIS